jgi:hypothetical protein
MTHKPEVLFAVEDDPPRPELSSGLAAYRRLSASQRAACAAELKRKVETEIAEQGRSSQQRQRGFIALLMESLFGRSLAQGGLVLLKTNPRASISRVNI